MGRGLQDEGRVEPAYTAEVERAEELIELSKTARLRMAQARECMKRATGDAGDVSYGAREYYLWQTITRMIEATEALTLALEIQETSDA